MIYGGVQSRWTVLIERKMDVVTILAKAQFKKNAETDACKKMVEGHYFIISPCRSTRF